MHDAPPPPPPVPVRSKTGGLLSRVLTGVITSVLFLSIGLNFYLGAWFASSMAGPSESTYTAGDWDRRIVILPINGMIDADTAKFVHQALKNLCEDPPRAVVLRVNSGGGSVAASDRIWHDVVTFKDQTRVPVVASFGSVAASGGYYIAAPADYIIAEPSTITGSIGVIAQAFTVQELLGKIGVKPELIVSTQSTKKDMLNPVREWTPQDRQMLRSILDHAYDQFVGVVEQGRRGLDKQQVQQLATGEVYTAQQAQANQLIDAQGYLDAAIVKARELAGIGQDEEPMVTIMSPPRGLSLFGAIRSPVTDPGSIGTPLIRRWLTDLSTPQIEYRWVP